MTMLIGKFHTLIQSRLLWGTFLVIIVFTFVIWGIQMPGQSGRNAEANAVGKLHGKLVPRQEFGRAYWDTYMSAVLSVGRRFDISTELDGEIRNAAWRRFIALKEAKELGLTASDEEVTATIQSHPGFQVEGRFSPAHYNAFVQNALRNMGFSEIQFEEHVRDEIALQKLRNMVGLGILISPYEVGRTFRSLSDSFEVDYVVLKPEDFAKEVKVTRDDAKAYFEADPEKFKLPDRVTVKYVEIPITNYLAGITNSEDDALGYYDEHIDEFTVTNEVAVSTSAAEESTNDLAAAVRVTNEVAILTFDQVKTNIMKIMTREKARDRAAEIATDFVVSLAPDREGNAPKFEEAAAKANLAVKTTDPFALYEPVGGVDADLRFNAAAFALNPTPDEYFSDAIIASNHVYVIGLDQKIPAAVPKFDDVADEVLEAAKEHATSETLTRKAQEIREAVVKAVASKKSFADGLKPFGFKALKTGEFTVSAGLETNDYSTVLIRGVIGQNEGEVTDLLTAEDAILIGYVAKRTPGDAAKLEALVPQIRDSVRRQRSRILFDEWEEDLLRQASFEDLAKRAPVEDEEGLEDEGGSATNDVQEEEEPLPEEPG